jgi:hypothetical protein
MSRYLSPRNFSKNTSLNSNNISINHLGHKIMCLCLLYWDLGNLIHLSLDTVEMAGSFRRKTRRISRQIQRGRKERNVVKKPTAGKGEIN